MIRKLLKVFGLIGLIFLTMSNLSLAQRQMEKLDRGVLAIKVGSTVHISWRVFGNEYFDVSYNVYRNSTILNSEPITGPSYFIDNNGSSDSAYSVSAIINGIEQSPSQPIGVWTQNFKDIPLQIPAGVITPDGVTCTYSANDCSVGDLDGDGQYEIIVKWDPSNSKDNANSGYTGNVYLDAYKLNGTKLWRIDLGVNIRAGAHYTQFMVYDLDGDGKAEIACKTAPGTKDATGNFLKLGPAASANHEAIYRNSSGYILSGPEYFTIFDGETGIELATVDYDPPRGNVASWGDTYGNRVDRFLACIAYLDGVKPSVVMCRGYYTGSGRGRTVLAAWDFRNNTLSHRWTFSADLIGAYPNYTGQGNHSLSVADVDGDGKDEIIYGSCTIDDDGTGLYSTGLGHGDALHVSDLDPDRPGLEVFAPHENKRDGVTFRDAATGAIIWQKPSGNDVGRALAADIIPGHKGAEFWAASGLGVYNTRGVTVGSIPSINHAIWWDGDDSRELLDDIYITKYGGSTLLTASVCASNNGTKKNPGLQVDLFGDWREEVIFRHANNTALRIYATTYATNRRLYTLMHDPVYRLGIAWQNVAYNQPPHTGFYLGNQMAPAPPPPINHEKLIWDVGNTWDVNISKNWTYNDTSAFYENGFNVLFDMTGSTATPIDLIDTLKPASVTVYSTSDYIFEGDGCLSGQMRLIKAGSGRLTIQNDNNFTGETSVWDGELILNGILSQSPVYVHKFASIGGKGIFNKGVTIPYGGNITVGNSGSADTLTILDSLYINGHVNIYLDLSADTSGLNIPNDFLFVDGNLMLLNTSKISISKLEGKLSAGTYQLIGFSGDFYGNIENVKVEGLTGYPYEIVLDDHAIRLRIIPTRIPSSLVWKGDKSNAWDQVTTYNWLNSDTSDWFVAFDTVTFDGSVTSVTGITLAHEVPVGDMYVKATNEFTFNGPGFISGTGRLIKSNTSKLTLATPNTYSGGTFIEAGNLTVNNVSGSATGQGPVTVKSTASLSGSGSVDGKVTIENNAAITLKNGTENSLLIRNDLEFLPGSYFEAEVRTNTNRSDTLSVTGELTLNGNLVLVNIGTSSYTTASRFKILNATNCKGTFSSITPATPGEFLKWDTTGLAATGIIKVVYYTGMIEEEIADIVNVFPNPVTDNLSISFKEPCDEAEINLRDLNGKTLYSITEKQPIEVIMNLSQIDAGVYIIQVNTKSQVFTMKIIKH